MRSKPGYRYPYQGVCALVEDVPQMMHRLVMEGPSISPLTIQPVTVGGAWVGGYSYYSMLANV